MSAAGQLIGRVRISEVWSALGGASLRHGRGRAFWRDGDGHNVSLSDEKGVWHDFATGEGGGVLDLVQHVRGGSRSDALRFVADLVGVLLNDGPLSPERKKTYGVHRRQAGDLAQECAWWAQALIEKLEHLKAGAYDRGDFDVLAWAGRELYQIQQAKPSGLMVRFVKALREDRENTLALIEIGRQDEQHAYMVTSLIVAMLVKAEKKREKQDGATEARVAHAA
jgi:hypothetical protein